MFIFLDEYHIRNFLDHFVIKNANANYRIVTIISDLFFEKDGFSYDSQQHRLRCYGYIIQLSIQAFLFGPLLEDVILNGGREEKKIQLPRNYKDRIR